VLLYVRNFVLAGVNVLARPLCGIPNKAGLVGMTDRGWVGLGSIICFYWLDSQDEPPRRYRDA
jgi:hypothetical protein